MEAELGQEIEGKVRFPIIPLLHREQHFFGLSLLRDGAMHNKP